MRSSWPQQWWGEEEEEEAEIAQLKAKRMVAGEEQACTPWFKAALIPALEAIPALGVSLLFLAPDTKPSYF